MLSGCETLKESKPIIPVMEFERLLVGRLDANYVGNDACLAKCHSHDQYRKDFEASTMGAQLSPGSGMPLVDCETCHGPVASMERVRQESDLSMGWCISCHREQVATPTCIAPDPNAEPHVSTDCVNCHL